MTRVCPERDARCPAGMDCPYADGAYSCKAGWRDARSPKLAGDYAELVKMREKIAAGKARRKGAKQGPIRG